MKDTDAEILAAKPTVIVLAGLEFTVAPPCRRVGRQWAAGMVRIVGSLQALEPITDPNQSPAPEILAKLFEVFDPICTFLAACSPTIRKHPTALDGATETELLQAFSAMRELIELPFAQPPTNVKLTLKPLDEILPSNTNAGPSETPIGNPAPTS